MSVEKSPHTADAPSQRRTNEHSASHAVEDVEEEEIDSNSIQLYNGAGLVALAPVASLRTQPSLNRSDYDLSRIDTAATDPAFEVDWQEDDKDNPQNWSIAYKAWVIATIAVSTTTIVLYSSAYTAGIPGLIVDLNVPGHSELLAILGLTTYLFGLAAGSIILAPLSEMYGRRPIFLASISVYIILIIPCALAKNIATILVIRFFAGVAGSPAISNSPGTINDIVGEEYRALAFSVWSIGPLNGPVIGPMIGGPIEQFLGWRWIEWVVMICSGVALAMHATNVETYAPALLRKRAKQKRKATNEPRWHSRYDEKANLRELLSMNLRRPLVISVTEPILIFWDVYIALVYAILYLSFVAYPIVFSGLRHWSSSLTGLAYAGIGLGNLLAISVEPLLRKIINSHKVDPETGRPPPEAMVSVVCGASILVPVGELWFAWTCTPNVHWIWPILAGVPFGAGNAVLFIYGGNYIVHCYGIYSASALSGNALLRSILGGALPLAGAAMYKTLGANWAGTMLGLLEVACIPIPFVFYRFGHKIRERSRLIRQMQNDKLKAENKRRAFAERHGYAVSATRDVAIDLEKHV